MSHTTTGQWQSFEGRMRQRRAERLLLRADVAAEAGCFDEAREALAEAHRLAPALPGLAETEQRVAQLQAAPLPTSTRRRQYAWAGAAAALLLMAFAAAFVLVRRPAQEAVAPTPAHAIESFAPRLSARSSATPSPSAAASTAQPLPITSAAGTSGSLPVEESPVRVETMDVTSSIIVTQHPQVETPRVEAAPTELSKKAAAEPLPNMPTAIDRLVLPATPTSTFAAAQPGPVQTAISDVPTLPAASRAAAPAPSDPIRQPSYMAGPPHELPTSAVRVTTPPPLATDEALVRRVLNRYATAYTALDVRAAKEAWPSVNGPALARAFDGLASQQVSLDDCSIDVRGAMAHAACNGKAMWRPKIGNGGTHTEQRKWAFELVKSGESWMIANAHVQNR